MIIDGGGWVIFDYKAATLGQEGVDQVKDIWTTVGHGAARGTIERATVIESGKTSSPDHPIVQLIRLWQGSNFVYIDF